MAIPSVGTWKEGTDRADRSHAAAGMTEETTLLDILGHDLRAPLTALKGRLQLMQRRLARQEDRGAESSDVAQAMFLVDRLNHALDVVRDASQLQQGRLVLIREEADLGAIVRRCVAQCTSPGPRSTIEVDIPEKPLLGMWDLARLGHALSAIIANAQRFGPDDGHVQVCVRRDATRAYVEVADQGIGVPTEDREVIFAAGRHGSNVQAGGAGLGLYVAREIVRLHGGDIGVSARPEGGSIFWIVLPLA